VPRKGYRTVRVADDIYGYLQKRAKEINHTIPEYISYLIEKNKAKGGK
jgi:predicted CopG family antitoxin